MTFESGAGWSVTQPQGNLAAILGPTNTGKTHLAIERMLAHQSGMIGLPLRLLAREVYHKVAERAGADAVALITGEEKIKPQGARYFVCTVEAMPRDIDVAFLAVDEIQLAADFDRGHVFTERLMTARGREETLLLGASTIRPLIETLLPGTNILSRPRLSQLHYAGQSKLSRLPRRSAIVAFSADEVYAIAELIRRQRGGTAVVLGALSPRTRNAQVALYQAGDVDYLVATDAIGMGLNLDIDHVAFASNRKFDGHQYRSLNAAEIGQIAGRAGRHVRNGTFGVTGRVEPFDADLVERLETHNFERLKVLQWRSTDLDFASPAALKASLSRTPEQPVLTRAPLAVDELALDVLMRDAQIADMAVGREAVAQLWQACQIPDYRKIAPANHADLVGSIYRFLRQQGRIPDDWFARQVAFADRTDGDIDTLSNRIAHIRTWTFVANRDEWLERPAEWQEATRQIEDRLSDALHERLAARFVDRRTSVLMRRLRENEDLELEIADGDVQVAGQHVGHLHGFRFAPDSAVEAAHGKALRAAAMKGLAGEYSRRADEIAAAGDEQFALAEEGHISWRGEAVADIARSDDVLRPAVRLRADDQLQAPDKARVQERLQAWLAQHVDSVLAPLAGLRRDEMLSGTARGLAFQLVENFGLLERAPVAAQVKSLEQEARAGLRRHGVRFGAHTLHIPDLLKPAAAGLVRLLWALRHGGTSPEALARLPQLAARGLMSVRIDPQVPRAYYRAIGYQLCGRRAVRADMLERLADLIRPLVAWKPAAGAPAPEGALGAGRFYVTPAMMSLVGCSGDDFADILKAIGFRLERKGGVEPAAPAPIPVVETPAGGGEAMAPEAASTESAPELAPEPAPMPPTEAGTEMAVEAKAEAETGVAALAEAESADVAPASASVPDAPVSVPPLPVAPDNADVWRLPGAGERRQPRREARQAAGEAGESERPRREDGRRRGRKPRQAQAGPRSDGGKPAARGDGADARRPRKPDNKPRERERKPDPDSPFAALAALKRAMETGASGS